MNNTNHSVYIPLTDEQRAAANSLKGEDQQTIKWMVLVPGSDRWELTGSLGCDAQCALPPNNRAK